MSETNHAPPLRALVTGGSSGIGRETALAFADHGYDVGITYRTGAKRAEAVVRDIEARSRTAWAARVDMASPVEAARAVERLSKAMGGVDVFVNNAGISPTAEFSAETIAGWTRTLDTNLTAPFLCAQKVARQMTRRHAGVIINITSVLESAPLAGKAAYCASKAGLAMLTRVMALELAKYGIRVLAVAPGHTATPMNFGRHHSPTTDPPTVPVVPLGRAGRTREIAETVVFAASQHAGYITGTTLLADGGMLLVNGAQILEEEAEHLRGPSYRLPS